MPPEFCSTDSRSTRKDKNKNEISDNIRGEGSVCVCVCVCVCVLREVCVSGGRGRVPVSLSGVQFSGEVRVHVVYQGPRLPAAGASRRR